MIFAKRMLLATISTLICLVTLAACETTTAISDPYKRAACEAWRPVSWADADTDATIADVKRNNVARAAFCEGLD